MRSAYAHRQRVDRGKTAVACGGYFRISRQAAGTVSSPSSHICLARCRIACLNWFSELSGRDRRNHTGLDVQVVSDRGSRSAGLARFAILHLRDDRQRRAVLRILKATRLPANQATRSRRVLHIVRIVLPAHDDHVPDTAARELAMMKKADVAVGITLPLQLADDTGVRCRV
jgi:hypothetical protein